MITNDGYENKEKIKTVIVLEICFVFLGGLFFIYNIYVDKCLNKNLKYLTVHIYNGFIFNLKCFFFFFVDTQMLLHIHFK